MRLFHLSNSYLAFVFVAVAVDTFVAALTGPCGERSRTLGWCPPTCVDVVLATCAELPGRRRGRRRCWPPRCDARRAVAAVAGLGRPARDWSATTPPVVIRSTWDYTRRRDRVPGLGAAGAAAAQPGRRRRVEHGQDLPARSRRGGRARRPDRVGRPGRAASTLPVDGRVRGQAVGRRRLARRRAGSPADERAAAREPRRRAARRRAHGPGAALPRRGRRRGRDGAGLLRRPVQPRRAQGAVLRARQRRTTCRRRVTCSSRRRCHRRDARPGTSSRSAPPSLDWLAATGSAPSCSTPGSTCCPAPDGPVVVELELIEPSLFLSYADGAADRPARAARDRRRGWRSRRVTLPLPDARSRLRGRCAG